MLTILQRGFNPVSNGGIEHFLLNIYAAIDKNQVKFIFLIDELDDCERFRKRVLQNGGEVVLVSKKGSSKISRFFNLIKILKKINYDVAHIHVTCGIRLFDGIACKIAKPKSKLFFHSHSNMGKRPIKYSILIPFYRLFANRLLACSKDAGRYFFGKNVDKLKKFTVVHNAIDVDEFRYSVNFRQKIRKEYDISLDDFVVGFVGRLSVQKNLFYAIKIFECIKLKVKNAKFVIVGDGSERDNLCDFVNRLGLSDSIFFAGNQTIVNQYMSAMDILLLPSLYEGLPVVLIEAQSETLQSFAADCVPEEARISNYLNFVSIKKTPEEFAEYVLNKFNKYRSSENSFVITNGFESKECAQRLLNMYRQ